MTTSDSVIYYSMNEESYSIDATRILTIYGQNQIFLLFYEINQ